MAPDEVAAAFGFFFTGFLGVGACEVDDVAEGGGVSCAALCQSGMCADALQERSFDASGCLE